MFNKLFNTQNYLGTQKRNWFEGWYFRVSGKTPVSFVVGISKNEAGPHSFIMFVSSEHSHVFKFGVNEFSFDKNNMTISIAGNTFGLAGINANLTDNNIKLAVNLMFAHHKAPKKSFYAPTAMGPFSYIKMPCSHAVVSMCGRVEGAVHFTYPAPSGHPFILKGNYRKGLVYIEKDFGSSFPQNYIWTQGMNGTLSIVFAYAYPLTLGLKGFICLVQYKNKTYNLSLYTLAKLNIYKQSEQELKAALTRGKYKLEINIKNKGNGCQLPSPIACGKMDGVICESLSAQMTGVFNAGNEVVEFSMPAAYEFVINKHKL
ncbi:MAG: hypothetical protein FWE53_04825 [Firmicutes bacterium]|nr:hypothetical protein [Bacillota bacterium]